MSDFFRRYLLPGFVFEAAVIGGGYATGRELVEFFLPAGPAGRPPGHGREHGSCGAPSSPPAFELARVARAYDYRSFTRLLLGPAWFLFEIAYVLLIVVIFAVMGAAAGRDRPQPVRPAEAGRHAAHDRRRGLVLFYPTAAIEKFLSVSVGYLYLVYFVFLTWSLFSFGGRIEAALAAEPLGQRWFMAGVTYAGYNVATIPAVLFCIRHLTSRREAVVAGLWPARSACCRASPSTSPWSATTRRSAARPCPRPSCSRSSAPRGSNGPSSSASC